MPMYTTPTIKASMVWSKSDGSVGGGLDLLWTTGAHVVICQEWRIDEEGVVCFDQVYPDPMSGDNLIDYFNGAVKGRQEKGRELVWTDAKLFS